MINIRFCRDDLREEAQEDNFGFHNFRLNANVFCETSYDRIVNVSILKNIYKCSDGQIINDIS